MKDASVSERMRLAVLTAALYLSKARRLKLVSEPYLEMFRGQLLRRFLDVGRHNADMIIRDESERRLYESFRSQRRRITAIAEKYMASDIFVWEPDPQFFKTKFFNASAPPTFFYVRSTRHDLSALAGNTIAVVGSRQPSAYGVAVTGRLVKSLADQGVIVISGGAAGIDGVAHRAALERGGLTAAVLGHGVDHVYPSKHQKLFDEIAQQGWLLSEYPPGVKPKRHYFPARNRLVAALSDALIVTAAKPKSGTLITASYAADQGKPVFAVPGSILDDEAASCHLLIKEGADLCTQVADLSSVFPHLR